MMLGMDVPKRTSSCGGALPLLLSLLLAGAAFLTFSRTSFEEDQAINMAAEVPAQPARTMQATSAIKTPSSEPSESATSAFLAKKDRREMFQGISKLAASFALAGAATRADKPASAAGSESAAVAAAPEKKDNRAGFLLVPLVALGWAGFNIGGPALNQLDDLNTEFASRDGEFVNRGGASKKKR